MRNGLIGTTFLCGWTLLGLPAFAAAELAVLTPDNWKDLAPGGKEADAIYGDLVLRNDRIVAVIAFPSQHRKANLTTGAVGGALIDLTLRAQSNDQLTAFYPGGPPGPYPLFEPEDQTFTYHFLGAEVDGQRLENPELNQLKLNKLNMSGKAVALYFVSKASGQLPRAELSYHLEQGSHSLLVKTRYLNPTLSEIQVSLADSVRMDNSRDQMAVDQSPDGHTSLFWVYDKWFGQAYGVLGERNELQIETGGRSGSQLAYLVDDDSQIMLRPGETYSLTRRIIPGASLLEVKGEAASLLGIPQELVRVHVSDGSGESVAAADIEVELNGQRYGWGRTDNEGAMRIQLPPGKAVARISALARGSASIVLDRSQSHPHRVILAEPGRVVARIRDEHGKGTPCKVQFFGRYGTSDPFFGPDTGEHGVHNVYYSQDGNFEQILAPGSYDVIVSHGPEYDAVFTEIVMVTGRKTPLEATLLRRVDTRGWVSADFHSHSSPSGDNTASQLGRVLNLLAEHIEFAPCTEHNRVSTYLPHLQTLGVEDRMATCPGIELTSAPGLLNHHNAFPLIRKPHTQDGGAPRISLDPEIQIERLALWDSESEKLVQQNHPDIELLFFDRDEDGVRDEGYSRMFGHMDVIEVHPARRYGRLSAIFRSPFTQKRGPDADPFSPHHSRIYSWIRTLNMGHRIPGVVNTDAHYTFHGSGWLRNYLKSSTDDPARIQTLEMVRSAERGNVIMTNGPFLEVKIRAQESSSKPQGTAGDDVVAPAGRVQLWVRVQCPNWFDIDRVQVLLNGRHSPELNFTRSSHPLLFSREVVRFEKEMKLQLKQDTHIIVATIGEESTLGPVMGPTHKEDQPVAISNPVFIDVDGQGFEPNRDPLDFE